MVLGGTFCSLLRKIDISAKEGHFLMSQITDIFVYETYEKNYF